MKRNPLNGQHKRFGKDKQYKDQYKATFESFYEQPSSMKEVSVKRGFDRANICWYCRDMRLNNTISVYKKGICSITKRLVNKYTTNPNLRPKPTPTLFDYD
jgi:hypothetical protein